MFNKLLMAAGILVAFGYLMHLAGPLKVVDDGPLYLAGATDIAMGSAYRESRMPRGYPQALATLDMLGLNSSAGIVGLNLVCMAIGLPLICSVIRSEMGLSARSCAVCALLCCFSWVWIYLAPIPVSDMVFFALSSAVLAALSQAKRRPGISAAALIAAAVVLSLAALFVRTIGAALFAAVAFAVLKMGVAWSRRAGIGRPTAVALLLVAVAIVGSIGFVGRNSVATPGYLQAWQGASSNRWNIPAWRITEIGEMFQNVSARAFPPKTNVLPIESVTTNDLLTRESQAISYVSGFAAIVLILFGALRRRKLSSIEVFLACYVGILLVWPFNDVRFWAPVLPLFLAYGWIGLRSVAHSRPAVTRAAACYCVVFCIFGAVAMAHSLKASLFDRGHTERISQEWMSSRADWKAAYERFGGERDAGNEPNATP
jgi:hypothetical protein